VHERLQRTHSWNWTVVLRRVVLIGLLYLCAQVLDRVRVRVRARVRVRVRMRVKVRVRSCSSGCSTCACRSSS